MGTELVEEELNGREMDWRRKREEEMKQEDRDGRELGRRDKKRQGR
jgi:hypothetical protein